MTVFNIKEGIGTYQYCIVGTGTMVFSGLRHSVGTPPVREWFVT